MKIKNIRSIAVALSLLLVGVMPMTALAAVPTITSISPSAVVTGSGAFALTVNGTNFDANSLVNVNGSARTTTFISPTQVTASIPAADLTAVGTLNVTVANPGAGGGVSNAQNFTVTGTATNPIPIISSISPALVVAGSGAFTLTVDGANFNTSSVVKFNGINKATTFVSSTQVRAAIAAADVAMTGSHIVNVVNPTPGGGTSNSILFTIAPTTGTPQLPDTGFGPAEESSAAGLLAAAIVMLATIGTALIVRRARLAK